MARHQHRWVRLALTPLERRDVPAGTGLTANYFDNSDFTTLKLTRTDAQVNFNWGTGSPSSTINADTFSAIWTGQLEPRFTERTTFTVDADDGYRLWIGDQLVVARANYTAGNTENNSSIDLQAGVRVNVRLEYTEGTGGARVQLLWSSPSLAREVVPASALYPTNPVDDRGSIRLETWNTLSGAAISDLTGNANYPNKPNSRDYLTSFESPGQSRADNYGSRVMGYLVPTVTGNYTFAVAADERAQLKLSTDNTPANAVQIAQVTSATAFRDFAAQAGQTSATVALIAGQKYYIELLHTDGTGSDHFSVAWQPPGATALTVIPGDVLIPYGVDAAQPTQATILNTLASGHSRLLATPEKWVTITQAVAQPGQQQTWYNTLKGKADGLLTTTVNTYVLNGSETTLLNTSRSVMDRIYTLASVYRISGNAAYASRAFDELNSAASFPDWNPAHFLDTAEMTHAFAIGYDWLYDYFTQAQRDTVRNAIITKGLNVGLTNYQNNVSWSKSTSNNWSFVCNGGLALGALAIADESPTLAADILNRAINAVRPMMAHWSADNGAWYEGPGYWGYSQQYLVRFLAGLETALGSDFGLGESPAFDRSGLQTLDATGPTGLAFNYSDGGTGKLTGATLFWLARRYDEPAYAAYQRTDTSPEAMDLVWFDPRGSIAADVNTRPLDDIFHGPTNAAYQPAEIAGFRQAWGDTSASYVGFKGNGKIGDNHGNLDAGDFVFDALGQRWAQDLGADNYGLPGYFSSPQRWTYYRLRAEGSNTLVVNPTSTADQVLNANAEVVSYNAENSADRSLAVVNLTPAYTGVTSVQRGVGLINGRHELLVQDEITAATPATVWWFMHVKLDPGQIAIAGDGKSAVLTQNGQRLYVKILSGNGTLSLMAATPLPTSPNPTGQDANVGFNKLAIQMTNVTNERLTVWMVPLAPGELVPTTTPTLTPLSDWGKTVNDPPAASGVATTPEDTAVDLDLRTLISDPETPASQLQFTVTGASNGTAVLQPDGYTVHFTPAANFNGTAGVTVTARDTYPDSRLLLAYTFESPAASSTATVSDRSNHERDGTLTVVGNGSASASPDRPAALGAMSAQSLDLHENGGGNAASVSRVIDSSEFNFGTSDWTMSAWFNRRDTESDDFVLYLGNSDGFGSVNEIQVVLPAGQNRLAVRVDAVPGELMSVPNVLAGAWYHVALRRNGTSLSVYLNGTLAGSATVPATIPLDSSVQFVAGGVVANSATYLPRMLDGKLDDVAVFSAALSPTEIGQLATAGVLRLGGATTSLTVPVTVTPVNDPPVLLAVAQNVPVNGSVDIDLRDYASDVETPATGLRFVVTGATNGTAVLQPDGHTVRFTATTGYNGPATFTWTATDTWIDPRTALSYRFEAPDTTDDGLTTDTSGHGLDGTLSVAGTGTLAYDATQVPSALAPFSTQSLKLLNPTTGNSARLTIPANQTGVNFNAESWSLSGWFRRGSTTSDDIIFYLGNGDGFGGNDELQLAAINGSNNLRLDHFTSAANDASITRANTLANTWYHAAVTYLSNGAGGGALSLYVNGTLVGSDSSFLFNFSTNSQVVFGGHAVTSNTTRYLDGWLDDVAVSKGALSAAEVAKLATADLTHAAGLTTTAPPATFAVGAAPHVQTVAINGGAAQRSRLTSIAVQFDSAVLFTGAAAAAFRLTGPGGAVVNASVTMNGNTATLTFPTLPLATLGNGRYVLTVLSNQVRNAAGNYLEGDNNTVPGGDYQYAGADLFRLYGDADGSGGVDAQDVTAFLNAYGTSNGQSGYVAYLDSDGNGSVDAQDVTAFLNTYGTIVP